MRTIFELFRVPKEDRRAVFLHLRSEIPEMELVYNRIMSNKDFRRKYVRGTKTDVRKAILTAYMVEYFTGVPAIYSLSMFLAESGLKPDLKNRFGSYGLAQISTGGPQVEFSSRFKSISPSIYRNRTNQIEYNILANTKAFRDINFSVLYSLPLRKRGSHRYLVKTSVKLKSGKIWNPMDIFMNPYLSGITSSFVLYANWGIAHKRGIVKQQYLTFDNPETPRMALVFYNIGGGANPKKRRAWTNGNKYSENIFGFMRVILFQTKNKKPREKHIADNK